MIQRLAYEWQYWRMRWREWRNLCQSCGRRPPWRSSGVYCQDCFDRVTGEMRRRMAVYRANAEQAHE